ncbi:glycosyl hydrolase [Deltaproteobacteria bacterium]|nr:glycosyl hydrolase [Deltaproteobacteria bacterium]
MSADMEWELIESAAGAWTGPQALPAAGWRAAIVPGTVAQSVGAGVDSVTDFDASDWWYRGRFSMAAPLRPSATSPPQEPGGGSETAIRINDSSYELVFEGLATLAEVWLNGAPLFTSRNMFRPRAVSVTGLLREENELVIAFRSVKAELAKKRPRPRWKTALVEQQNLRWLRTSLLGRIPGWTPKLAPVGPWRAVRLEAIRSFHVEQLEIRTELVGLTGQVVVDARVRSRAGGLAGASLHVAGQAASLAVEDLGGGLFRVVGQLHVPGAPVWWPHTHGQPGLVEASLQLSGGGEWQDVALGRLGFRSVALDTSHAGVQLVVNGRPIFARGACWTVGDAASIDGSPDVLVETLRLAKKAGINLIRVGGTMVYPSDTFLRLCDRLGILVWQDFMFANMDYPFADPEFRAEVDAEVVAQLRRLQRHPCIAVYCGGSEVEQQASMVGLPRAEWSSPFFAEELPARCAQHHPGIPYFPSTPTGGALPFSTAEGITHYYGVGAYRRPLADARAAAVKFTAECLGFSNVPEPESMALLPGGATPPPHHPAWKAGVPRDNGAGWDFEDIRDHYLRELFRIDPVALRTVDLERYYALSRVVTGEVMKAVFAEWRRPGSGCGGALVWFLKDLRAGAGWGVIDSINRPKAAWWYLKRAWASQAALLTDEGLNGLCVHVHNETAEVLDATVEIELLRSGRQRIEFAIAPVSLAPFSSVTLSGDALIGHFTDLTHAYRFGPPRHDVVVVRLLSGDGVLHEDVFFPGGHTLPVQEAPDWKASAVAGTDGNVELVIEARTFLQAVAISSPGYEPDDNYFHYTPGRPRTLCFTPQPGAKAFKAHITALNVDGMLTVRA